MDAGLKIKEGGSYKTQEDQKMGEDENAQMQHIKMFGQKQMDLEPF